MVKKSYVKKCIESKDSKGMKKGKEECEEGGKEKRRIWKRK